MSCIRLQSESAAGTQAPFTLLIDCLETSALYRG